MISLFAKILLGLRSAADQLEKQIFMAAQENERFWQSVQLLTSIPGIGPYSSIIILDEIGDFSRFKKPGQLVSIVGMDPKVNQSGARFSLHNKLSKRGSPYLRSILDTCTHVAAHPGKNQALANLILAAYYQEKRRSKPANVAMCACIHKMLGYIYAVLRERKPFVLRTPEEHIVLMRANVHPTVA